MIISQNIMGPALVRGPMRIDALLQFFAALFLCQCEAAKDRRCSRDPCRIAPIFHSGFNAATDVPSSNASDHSTKEQANSIV